MSQFRQSIIVLEDLKLLSSELGRTAIISSLICWVGNFLLVLIIFLPFSYECYLLTDNIRRWVPVCCRDLGLLYGQCSCQAVRAIKIGKLVNVSNVGLESFLVVNLMFFVSTVGKLLGTIIPSLHYKRKQDTSVNSGKPTRASGIIKCFNQYEEQKQRFVDVECFTSVVPCSTMHDDICSLANEKSTTLIIFPFQNFENSYIRGVNKHVLDNAPCSVAIFFGHRILAEPRFLYSNIMTSGVNMAETIQDAEAIGTFKMKTYKIKVKESMENEFDLMLVGRRHDDDNSTILKGLSERTEIEELGAIGDLMLSWDVSRASIWWCNSKL
ncbi:hypothetical protein Ddye_018469 [Dipteronia dyeriana]|uniref:Uncharacterized protein n=1 Tax=Dipteronia dyeriana TaxID=168575 RepID=A0AAD9UBH5_9ROSI|nr:hypothetical protein Ddye_018469 [Dipteronia dyeriana]